HHTDYAGVVWHGTYIAWMEEARVECLRSLGVEFADWVNAGFDLPVVDVSLNYHRPLRMGMQACIKTRLVKSQGVRLNWRYQIQALENQELCVTGQVTLVPVDIKKGKIVRRLTPDLQSALDKLLDKFQ
nr:thioesterase family protein [Leptolyngbyaceae cyanobacterium MO_188.B28]